MQAPLLLPPCNGKYLPSEQRSHEEFEMAAEAVENLPLEHSEHVAEP